MFLSSLTDTMAFSKLTLHQAKRYEMESQVRVLELQSDLEKERIKLSELRKMHYRLAGESEGWEQEVGGRGRWGGGATWEAGCYMGGGGLYGR